MEWLEGKVFVTGGTGFLARGHYRRARREMWPCTFTAFSRDDGKQAALQAQYPEVRCVRGDVAGDIDYLTAAMTGHDTVIHAAAAKYVDRSEFAAFDTVRVNVQGSINVMHAAIRAGVRRVVGISTDKACAAVSVYGMTKAVMERVFSEASANGRTVFTCVRYGNVVGSTGSVIPLFRRQYAEAGEVQVTNPQMTRFWLSVDQAIDLVLLALSDRVHPGAIVVPYAAAMTLEQLVAAVCPDATVKIIGERAGERRDERLIHFEESVRVQRHSDFFEVLPVGNRAGEAPFTLSSNTPQQWLTVEEMQALILDSESV